MTRAPHFPEKKQRYLIYNIYLSFLYFRATSASYVQVSPMRPKEKDERIPRERFP